MNPRLQNNLEMSSYTKYIKVAFENSNVGLSRRGVGEKWLGDQEATGPSVARHQEDKRA